MTIPAEIESALALEDFEAVESRWLELMDEDARSVEMLAGIAEELAGAGDSSRASLLLGLLDDELRDSDPEARLRLLKAGGRRLFNARELHSEIVGTLESLYSDRDQLPDLLAAVRLRSPGRTPAETWERVDKFERLILLVPGVIVWMEGKGVGTITEVNLGLQSLKVDFERIKGLSVGFKVASKLLHQLPDDHVLRRKLEEPDELKDLAKKDPPEVLRAVLQSFDKPMTAGEIREALDGVVASRSWASWWSRARQHPQVLTKAGARPTYSWASSGDEALKSVESAFEEADLNGRLEIFRRQTKQDAGSTAKMVEALCATAEDAATSDPAAAMKVWLALDRAGKAPGDTPWSLPGLVRDQSDFGPMFSALEARADRQLLLESIREHRDDWSDVFLKQLLVEEDPRLLTLVAADLAGARAEDLEATLDRVASMPARNPSTFVWLAERAADDETLAQRQPTRLLRQILKARSSTPFDSYRSRVSSLFESGGTVPKLLNHLDSDGAVKAKQAFEESQIPEDELRPLLTALELRFPELRTETEAPLYATPASISTRKQELKELLEVEIPANRKAIQEARELGDLRENFEYKSARQRHEYLSARSAKLANELERVRPLELQGLDIAEVRIGSRVGLSGAEGKTAYTILGPWESDPDQGVISYESELATGLLGSQIGDEVQISGSNWTVDSIEPATLPD